MPGKHFISPKELDFDTIREIISQNQTLALSGESRERINGCREFLDKRISGNSEPIYGINTGFGSLCDKSVSHDDLANLQKNLVMSHACGMGDEIDPVIVKLMILFKVQSLSYGHSGVQMKTVDRLIDFFNLNILPVVYKYGSLGASGDLAPLAHLSLPLLGLGEVNHEGKKLKATDVLKKYKWSPIELESKEGLALLNGTQFMSAIGVWCLLEAQRLALLSDTIGALSLDAYYGKIEPFLEKVHQVRPHPGQLITAENFRKLLEGSEILALPKKHVQDPYSFRCIPQVHGASRDAINYVSGVFKREINSVTDNPTIFSEENQIISAGNFHGQPLAITMDFLCIALAELGSISERRTYQLISGRRGLPSFLVANPGLNSGLMIPQYTAASMVSKNKQLCMPASVDSIDSSQGQEDHVSMGANAALKLMEVVRNVYRILAIELMNASQAIEFRRPLKTSETLESFLFEFRKEVPFIENDKMMFPELHKADAFVAGVELPKVLTTI
jgi:histidine ammonia-lyase